MIANKPCLSSDQSAELSQKPDDVLEIIGSAHPRILMAIVSCSFVWAFGAMAIMSSAFITIDCGDCNGTLITIVSEFDLRGGKAYLADWSTSFFMVTIIFYISFLSLLNCYTSEHEFIMLICWLLGKFSISCSFMSLFVYATEIFPTNIRNVLIGMCSVLARIGGIAAPYIRYFFYSMYSYIFQGSISPVMPIIVLGSMSTIAGILTVFLPETHRKPLPHALDTKFSKTYEHTKMNIDKCHQSINIGSGEKLRHLVFTPIASEFFANKYVEVLHQMASNIIEYVMSNLFHYLIWYKNKRSFQIGVKGLMQEFASIRAETQPIGNKPKTTFDTNIDKNRYKGNDYIHANWVTGTITPKKFICTQPPAKLMSRRKVYNPNMIKKSINNELRKWLLQQKSKILSRTMIKCAKRKGFDRIILLSEYISYDIKFSIL
uniref:Tyrosine-protein phosphatase domain-containing protein n=1 Tax=Heterorhabditis bacteriophora TaxID=37862 RepID=A0A1I7WBW3_HETBA